MEFLLRPRSPGKRQVKPSQDIALLEEQIAGDESSDEEFKIDDGADDSDENKGSDDDSDDDSDSSSDGSGDDDEGSVKGDELSALKSDLTTEELIAAAQRSRQQASSEHHVPVCGCCLGTQSSDANEIVECDGCGISVHEACYGIIGASDDHGAAADRGDDASTVSSASTEPWFCEPCRAGLVGSPNCELCPNQGGIYKRTDVGRWIHLVCALYTPGVAFAEPDKLSCVTVFEMNYGQFGRRHCSLCTDVKMARTGVCINCDAGMCKQYFHVSCGLAAGLLSEPLYKSDASTPAADHYLGHCKIHTDRTVIRKRRKSFLSHLIQTEGRMEAIRRRHELAHSQSQSGQSRVKQEEGGEHTDESADERILRKLRKSQVRYAVERSKKPDPWLPNRRIARLLTTSSSAIRKLEKMAELQHGVSVARQRQQEQDLLAVTDIKKKWYVQPSFSVEFTAYFHDRQGRISDLKKTLAEHVKVQSSLKERETVTRPNFDLHNRRYEMSLADAKELRKTDELYRSVLTALCPTLVLPECPKPVRRDSLSAPDALNFASALPFAAEASETEVTAAAGSSLHACGICRKTSAQHLLAHCDKCRLHYHLGCLNPPLTRMPKKSKLYGWQCSECTEKDSASETEEVDLEAPRKKRMAAKRAAANSRANSDDVDDEVVFWPQGDMAAAVAASTLTSEQRQKKRKRSKEGAAGMTNGESARSPSSPVDVTKAAADLAADEAKRQSLIEQQLGSSQHTLEKKKKKKKKKKKRRRQTDDEEEEGENDDDGGGEPELIEDGGTCVVRIEPKPMKTKNKIKLKIKTPTNVIDQQQQQQQQQSTSAAASLSPSLPQPAAASASASACSAMPPPPTVPPPSSNSSKPVYSNGNGSTAAPSVVTSTNAASAASAAGESDPFEFDDGVQPPAAKKRKRSSLKDVRTGCDVCNKEGTNENLVRCDECRRCFHFTCLMPPVKKSPKVAGYSWHCKECDTSDRDSDWHLD